MRSVLRNNWDFPLALSDHQKTSILLKVSQGETPAAIARSLGIYRATVGRVIERSKWPAQATRKLKWSGKIGQRAKIHKQKMLRLGL